MLGADDGQEVHDRIAQVNTASAVTSDKKMTSTQSVVIGMLLNSNRVVRSAYEFSNKCISIVEGENSFNFVYIPLDEGTGQLHRYLLIPSNDVSVVCRIVGVLAVGHETVFGWKQAVASRQRANIDRCSGGE